MEMMVVISIDMNMDMVLDLDLDMSIAMVISLLFIVHCCLSYITHIIKSAGRV